MKKRVKLGKKKDTSRKEKKNKWNKKKKKEIKEDQGKEEAMEKRDTSGGVRIEHARYKKECKNRSKTIENTNEKKS